MKHKIENHNLVQQEINDFRGALYQCMDDSPRGRQSGSWAAAFRISSSQFSKCRPEQTNPHHFPTEKIPNVLRESQHMGPLQKMFIESGESPEFARWAAERCGLNIEEGLREKRMRELREELAMLEAGGHT